MPGTVRRGRPARLLTVGHRPGCGHPGHLSESSPGYQSTAQLPCGPVSASSRRRPGVITEWTWTYEGCRRLRTAIACALGAGVQRDVPRGQVPWYSRDGSEFTYDFRVGFDEDKAPCSSANRHGSAQCGDVDKPGGPGMVRTAFPIRRPVAGQQVMRRYLHKRVQVASLVATVRNVRHRSARPFDRLGVPRGRAERPDPERRGLDQTSAPGRPYRRLSVVVPVYAGPDLDGCGVDM